MYNLLKDQSINLKFISHKHLDVKFSSQTKISFQSLITVIIQQHHHSIKILCLLIMHTICINILSEFIFSIYIIFPESVIKVVHSVR